MMRYYESLVPGQRECEFFQFCNLLLVIVVADGFYRGCSLLLSRLHSCARWILKEMLEQVSKIVHIL